MNLNIIKINIPIGKVIQMRCIKDGIQINTLVSRRSGKKIDWQEITIHSTANLNSTPENEAKWLTNLSNDRIASWHYCVNADTIVEAIPAGEEAYHANSSTNNTKTVSIEICESGDIRANILMGAKLTAELLHSKNLKVDRVHPHRYYYTPKNCPRIIPNGKPWDDFIALVQIELDKLIEDNKTKEEKLQEINYFELIQMAQSKDEALDLLMIRQGKIIKMYREKLINELKWNEMLVSQGKLIDFIYDKFDKDEIK